MKKILTTALAAGVFFLATACPNLIDQNAIKELEDDSPPSITINSPYDGAEYTQTVVVTGIARDQGGQIRRLKYEVAGTLGSLITGSLAGDQLSGDGGFTFQFPTVSFDGPIVITINVEDWNDNSVSASVNLQYPGSSVSSLEAAAANKSIELIWDAVDGAADYTIYYTTNGTLPSESYGEQITVSGTAYSFENLENGDLHIFLLRANLSGGGFYWSSYVSAIPLSSLTLAPLMTAGYGEISLEWSEIEASNQFEVLRSTTPSGPFENYSGVIQGNEYVDTAVADGIWYYYKLRPALEGSIESHANAAQTFQVSPSLEEGISTLNTPEPGNKVKFPDWGGSYAYVAAGTAGLLVVDISTPRDPEIVASLDTTDAKDLALYDYGGGILYAYVADGAGKVRAINISNPLNPYLAGSYTGALGDASAIAVESGQGRLYVIDSSGETSLLALNIASPGGMTLIDSLSDGASYDYLDVDISYYSNTYTFIYLTTSDDDILLEYYLVSGTTLTAWRSYDDPGYRAKYVDVEGSYVYVLGSAKAYLEPPPPYALLVMNKYPSSLSKAGETESSNGYIADLTVRGDRAYAADGLGLHLIDVASPSSPEFLYFWDTPGASTGAATNGSYGFVSSNILVGFQTVDLSLPSTLAVEGSYDPGGGYTGLAVRDELLYAAGSNSFQILDISNPDSPSPISGGAVAITGARSVALSGSYAFVGAGTSGLKVVDISEPGSPIIAGSAAALSGSVGRITIKGEYAFLAGSTGLQIYDISDPAVPFGVGFYDTDGGGMNDVAIRGNTAYVTQGAYFQPNNLTLLDISDSHLPSLLGKLSFGLTLGGISLAGDYAYVGDDFGGFGSNGMAAVNINPGDGDFLNAPTYCEPFSDGVGQMTDQAAFGDFAYVLDPVKGLMIIDISDPANLDDSDYIRSLDWTNSNPEEIILDGGYALIADSTEGLVIVDLFP